MKQIGAMVGSYPKPLRVKELRDWLNSDRVLPSLIDVREDNELKLAAFPHPVLHFPLSRSMEWQSQIKEQLHENLSIVAFCHKGVRSNHFGLWLLDQDWGLEVWNLIGGIDAWSLEVNATVPRY